MCTARIVWAAVSAAFLLSPIAAQSAGVQAQAPCTVNQVGYCKTFSSLNAIPLIRSFTFTMPKAGRAVARFDGTLECRMDAQSQNVIDLAGQIVTSATAVPDYTKPGGGRHRATIDHFNFNTTSEITFNLATTRTISYGSGGSQIVYFKLRRLRQDAGWTCYVMSAAFTVTFFP